MNDYDSELNATAFWLLLTICGIAAGVAGAIWAIVSIIKIIVGW